MTIDTELARAQLQELADLSALPLEKMKASVHFNGVLWTGTIEIFGPRGEHSIMSGSGGTAQQMLEASSAWIAAHRIVASRMPFRDFANQVIAAIGEVLPDAGVPGNLETDTGVYLWVNKGRQVQLNGSEESGEGELHLWAHDNSFRYETVVHRFDEPNLINVTNLSIGFLDRSLIR
jgi:hypothetical protein